MWSVPMALVRMRWAVCFNPHNELWGYDVIRVYDTQLLDMIQILLGLIKVISVEWRGNLIPTCILNKRRSRDQHDSHRFQPVGYKVGTVDRMP